MMKTSVLITISMGCSISYASAQVSTLPKGKPPLTAEQAELLKGVVAQHAKAVQTGLAQVGAPATGSKSTFRTTLSSGWNTFHATNCGWFGDSAGNQWFFVFPSEGGIVYAINNLYISQGLQISCADGLPFAVFVINTSTGAYNQTWSFPNP